MHISNKASNPTSAGPSQVDSVPDVPSSVPVVSVTDIEAGLIAALARRLPSIGTTPQSVEDFLLASSLAGDELPLELRSAIRNFSRFSNEDGALLIRNLPTGILPPTPDHADLGVGLTTLASKVFALVTSRAGDIYGFKAELGGRVIQDLLPVRGFEDTQQSISSESLLILHGETVFTPWRADTLALLCLRADHERQAATLLTSLPRMLPHLKAHHVEVLRQERFSTTVDDSFLRGSGLAGPLLVEPIAVLTGHPDRMRLRCDFNETRGLDSEAASALATLHRVASRTAHEVRLEEGDLLLIDNHTTFHGRTSFNARHDGMDRWLLRTFVARDLSRSAADRPGNGRVIEIELADTAQIL